MLPSQTGVGGRQERWGGGKGEAGELWQPDENYKKEQHVSEKTTINNQLHS